MNQSIIFSLPAAAADITPFARVKMTSTGVALAGAADVAIGTFLPADPGMDREAAIQPFGIGLHFAIIGNGTDVAVGDELQPAAGGKLVKKTTGPTVAVACEACTDENDVIRVRYVEQTNAMRVIAAGVHTWAGGAATTDSIAVVGLETTDVVICTLAARASTETLVLVANDGGNDQIDLTLSANGTNGTTKVSYLVLRA